MKNSLLIVAIVALAIATGINLWLTFSDAGTNSSQETRIAGIAEENKSNLEKEHDARLITISQRCDFTKKVTHVLVKNHDVPDAKPFVKSYDECEVQLAKLKGVKPKGSNARTVPQETHYELGDEALLRHF